MFHIRLGWHLGQITFIGAIGNRTPQILKRFQNYLCSFSCYNPYLRKQIESASRRNGERSSSYEVSLGGPGKLYGVVYIPAQCPQSNNFSISALIFLIYVILIDVLLMILQCTALVNIVRVEMNEFAFRIFEVVDPAFVATMLPMSVRICCSNGMLLL